MEKPHDKHMYLKQKLFRGFEYCKIDSMLISNKIINFKC